jgi:hypothetical protein
MDMFRSLAVARTQLAITKRSAIGNFLDLLIRKHGRRNQSLHLGFSLCKIIKEIISISPACSNQNHHATMLQPSINQ